MVVVAVGVAVGVAVVVVVGVAVGVVVVVGVAVVVVVGVAVGVVVVVGVAVGVAVGVGVVMATDQQFSLSPAQAGTIDGMGAVVVQESTEKSAVLAVDTTDLTSWWVNGQGEREKHKDGPDLTPASVSDFPEALRELRRPMMPAAVRWKVQAAMPKANPKKALIVPYVDARLVVAHLDAICPGEWSEGDPAHPELPPFQMVDWYGGRGALLCRLTVMEATRQDVGLGNYDAKGLVSDALKRAAVKFGIGRFLYAMPKVTFTVESRLVYVFGEKKTTYLSDEAIPELVRIYTRWLWEHGMDAFGAPLDHGDSAAAVGDVESNLDEPEGEPRDPDSPPSKEQKARREMRAAAAGEKK